MQCTYILDFAYDYVGVRVHDIQNLEHEYIYIYKRTFFQSDVSVSQLTH